MRLWPSSRNAEQACRPRTAGKDSMDLLQPWHSLWAARAPRAHHQSSVANPVLLFKMGSKQLLERCDAEAEKLRADLATRERKVCVRSCTSDVIAQW